LLAQRRVRIEGLANYRDGNVNGSGFVFVLVRPKSPGNIGASARALKNMGFRELRLVAPQARDARPELAMAVHARELYDATPTYPDLAAAIADCAIVVGTTAHTGPYRDQARPLRETVAELARLSAANRVGLVFGPEDFGLANDDLRHCPRLITIPADRDYSSLNLAQAVMLVAYELRLALAAPIWPPVEPYASAGAVEAMLGRMKEALLAVGFLVEDNPDHIMFSIREIFGRSGLRTRELEILNGIARQIRWFASGGRETLAAKGRK
jgi:tRNA/rRNA methyltransferase